MEGNKNEALRCVAIAQEAIASGNKRRALKFLQITQRLNRDSPAAPAKKPSPPLGGLVGESNYTVENAQLVREIKGKIDYYAILGLEKSCSVEEIRRAYRKLSLKVHPDKNKAPCSEDAFKKVSKAFKCLRDDGSRRIYDQTGTLNDFDNSDVGTFRRRRRRTTTTTTTSTHDFFQDEFDPDEIFRAFFGTQNQQHKHEFNTGSGGRHHNVMLRIQLLPFLIILLLAYLPFSEPQYSLRKNYSYQIPMTKERHGVQFFVKSQDFDVNYPWGSDAR